MTTNDTHTDLQDALEEERRIINAATDCEAEYYEGRSFDGLHEVRGVGNYNNDSSIAEDRFMIPADGKRLAHSWNALPLRNAQLEAVHEALLTQEATAHRFAVQGHTVEAHAMKNSLAKIRRAIEEAGA